MEFLSSSSIPQPYIYKYMQVLINLLFCFFPVFKFFLVYFRTFSDIPIALIVSIATVYEERREVCRKCFFGERSLSGNGGSGMCSEGEHTWSNPVTVIPGQFYLEPSIHGHV